MSLQTLSDQALNRAEKQTAESVTKHFDGSPYHACKGCGPLFNRLWAIWDEIKARKDRR